MSKPCQLTARNNQSQPVVTMKQLVSTLALIGAAGIAHAAAPTPSYQWDFNLTNSASGTNLVYSAVPGGNIQGAGAPTQMGILEMRNSSATPVNLLGLQGSGVGTNTYDRAVLLNGSMGGTGPIVNTPVIDNTITNLGFVTNFTITAWIKADAAINSGFPRILLFGQQFLDTSSGLNNVSLIIYNNGFGTANSLELGVNHSGGGNTDAGNGFLLLNGLHPTGTEDWTFVAVTYDSTVDPLVTSNVFFYVADRFNSVGAVPNSTVGRAFARTSVNSVDPASPNGPGYLNFDPEQLNGDATTFGRTNVWVYVGNRSSQNRSFNGRYDDIRLYANRVLTEAELEEVRLDPGLSLPGPLQVTQPPQNTTVAEGESATFTATTTPAPNLTYQWYMRVNGTGPTNLITGATNQIYTTNNVALTDNGNTYQVRVTSTDPHAGTVLSDFGKLTVVPSSSYVATPGMLRFDYFAADAGTSVDNFLNSPTANYASNAPTLTVYIPTLDSRSVFPDDTHNNYFVRISGSITPTVTTNYVFYIRAADQAQFYLSTDGGATSNLLCSETVDGIQMFTGPESSISTPGGRFSSPIALQAGISYPVYCFYKAATGVDMAQVAWRMDSGLQDLPAVDAELADRLQPIGSAVLSTPALPAGTVSISAQPQPASVPAGSKVTFNVGFSTSLSTNNAATTNGPVVAQWRKNGVNIPGATGSSYTTPYLTTGDNGAAYSVVVSIPGASVTSSVPAVSVTSDNVLPTVVSAASDDSMRAVVVHFSEPLDPLTALNPANYSIPGLSVSGVTWAVSSNVVSNPANDAVKLTTSGQADNTAYTVTVSNVKDASGNTIGSGNTATITSFGFSPGFAKFEYFENQTYTSILDVNTFIYTSPKFTNNDPDTVVFPTLAEMSPDGSSATRTGANLNTVPNSFGTRMSLMFVPPVTTNYVFYVAADETAVLWLSTNSDPANKRVIVYQPAATFRRNWGVAGSDTATFDTNNIATYVTGPDAAPWPVADAFNRAVITLEAGQRYYLELDHIENAGFASVDAVTYAMAADNDTVVVPAVNSDPISGAAMGWYFPQPQITQITQNAGQVTITWTNSLGKINLGAVPFPGIAPGTITSSFPTNSLQASPALSPASWTTLTNVSPASFPTTNAMQFFRVGAQ
jgi:hypothetical protein